MGTGLQYQDIQKRSYMIWERQGRPHGHDLDHWLQAERELQQENGRPAESPTMVMQESPAMAIEKKAPAARKRKAPAAKPTLAS